MSSRGPVFASAARAPLTSVASAVEMTGDYTLTLPVMLATATATSARSATATIYTTKLLRRGYDIDRAAPGGPSATSRPPARCAPSPAPLTVPGRHTVTPAGRARAGDVRATGDQGGAGR